MNSFFLFLFLLRRVLFGDLEFKPADKFSTSARQLISGLLRRDPSLRLGAWASPPTDLMSQTFFSGVNWEAALRKDSDGPWVPAPVDYPMVLSSRSTSVDNVLSPTSPVTELGVPVASPTRDDNMINTKDSIPTNAPIQSTLTTGILTTEAHVKQTQLLTADMSAVRAAAVLRSGGVFAKPSTSSGQGAQVPMISSETSKQQPQYSFRSPMMKIGSGHRAAVVTPATVDTCLSDAVSPVLSPTENQENLPVNLLGSTTTNTALATQKPAVVQKFTHVETKEEIRRLSLDFRASDGTKNRSTVAPVEEEELIPNRDSIFISGSTSHAVAGWSFVDVRAIRMALANGHVR